MRVKFCSGFVLCLKRFQFLFFCFVFCCCPALERENLIFLFISHGRRSSARWEVGCLVPRVGAGTFRLWLEFYCTLMRDRRHLQISWFYLKKVAPTLKQMAYKLCRKANGKTRCAAEILGAFQDEIFGQWLPSGLPRVAGIRNSIALLSFLMICIPCNHILVTKSCVKVVQICVKSSRRHHLDIKTYGTINVYCAQNICIPYRNTCLHSYLRGSVVFICRFGIESFHAPLPISSLCPSLMRPSLTARSPSYCKGFGR